MDVAPLNPVCEGQECEQLEAHLAQGLVHCAGERASACEHVNILTGDGSHWEKKVVLRMLLAGTSSRPSHLRVLPSIMIS